MHCVWILFASCSLNVGIYSKPNDGTDLGTELNNVQRQMRQHYVKIAHDPQ